MRRVSSQTERGNTKRKAQTAISQFDDFQQHFPLLLSSSNSFVPYATLFLSFLNIKTDKMSSNHFEGQASTNYKEAFSLFDTRGVGRVVLDKLGDLLRACGQNPTLAEIRDLEKSVGGECEYSCSCHSIFGACSLQRLRIRPAVARETDS